MLTDVSVAGRGEGGLVARALRRQGRRGRRSTWSATAVGRRWTATRDLADALEHLGVVAVVAAAAGDEAAALEDELFAFEQARRRQPRAARRAVRPGPLASTTSRRWSTACSTARPLGATVRLAQQSLAGTHRTVARRARGLPEDRRRRTRSGWSPPSAWPRSRWPTPSRSGSAHALTAAVRPRRCTSTSWSTPSVIGGIRVEIGDDVIDGTVASRLDDARRGSPAEPDRSPTTHPELHEQTKRAGREMTELSIRPDEIRDALQRFVSRLPARDGQPRRGRHRRRGRRRHRPRQRPALGDGQRAARVRGRHARPRAEPRHPRDRCRHPR